MALQDNGNIIDSMVNTQKQVLDTIVENTKKLTNGNDKVNETIDKGTEWYKNWLETQKNMFSKTEEKAAAATETVKENASKMNEFYQNWFKTQMETAKQFWEKAQEGVKNMATANNTNTANPFAQWQNNLNNMNHMNQWNNWMNQMSSMNPMANMSNMNPFANMSNMNPMANMTNMFSNDAMKKATDNVTGMFNQYYTMMQNGMADWQKNLQGGNLQDTFKNMINSGAGFTKFAEMWTPMFKSIQEKTFNMDVYKQFMNPELYKDMMDKYLGLLPEGAREQMNSMNSMMTENMKKMQQQGMEGYNQMRSMMGQMGNGSEMFGNMLTGYNQFKSMMNEAAGPFVKLIPANEQTKTMNAWSDIANRIALYNIKNAELQYMIYAKGGSIMDALAENVSKKVQDGVEVKSMLGLYQEWLNISDKVFVNLFESDEYSKLMAEVGSIQMRLRRDINLQMEKSFENLPLAKSSEIEELTKTIYDLKKQVRELQAKMNIETPAVAETEEVVAEKAAKAKATKK